MAAEVRDRDKGKQGSIRRARFRFSSFFFPQPTYCKYRHEIHHSAPSYADSFSLKAHVQTDLICRHGQWVWSLVCVRGGKSRFKILDRNRKKQGGGRGEALVQVLRRTEPSGYPRRTTRNARQVVLHDFVKRLLPMPCRCRAARSSLHVALWARLLRQQLTRTAPRERRRSHHTIPVRRWLE